MKHKCKLGLVLILTLLLSMSAACSKEKVSSKDTQLEDTQPEEILLSDCRIVYDKEDFMSKRYAYRLFAQIRVLTGKGLECTAEDVSEDTDKIVVVENEELEKGTAKIEVQDHTILCQVNTYYGFEAVLDYLSSACEKGKEYVLKNGFTWTGSYVDTLEEIEDSNAYAYDRKGDYRVMFNNVLWLSPGSVANDKAGERNVLTVEMVKQYMPDVIGMQECDATKREDAKEQNMVTLLEQLGYAEVNVTVDNSLGVNCTPIFYRQDTMIPVTGGYWNYKNQPYEESEQNMSSKGLTWCLFETKTGEEFIVVSTHMETRDSSVRYNQAEEVTKLIGELEKKYNVPVVLGGDFNTVTGSTTFQYLTKDAGFMDAAGNGEVFNSITKPNHAYPQYKIMREQMDFNGMHGLSGEIIVKEGGLGVDHIVLKNNGSLQLAVYGVVVDDCTKAASDHFPTFIDFSIKG